MQLDDLTPEQARRFQLWSALTELSRARSDGYLTDEQVTLLETLAGNLQSLAGQLTELADRGREVLRLSRQVGLPPADA